MKSSDLQRIEHIRSYCADVINTVVRFGNDFDTFLADKDYLNSVSMSILQIGELSVGLSDEFKKTTGKSIPWDAVRGMRNMYAHAYAKMDKMTIWDTATKDVPTLFELCENIIDQDREEPAAEKPSVLAKLHTPIDTDAKAQVPDTPQKKKNINHER